MAKLNAEFGLDSNAISIDALKSAEQGDMVIFVGESGAINLFTVESKVTTRGRKGGTALSLSDFVNDGILDLPTTNALPEGVVMVRKVLKGVNVRTIRRAVPADLTTQAIVPISAQEPIVSDDVVLEPASETVADEVAQCAFLSEMSESDRLIAEILAGA